MQRKPGENKALYIEQEAKHGADPESWRIQSAADPIRKTGSTIKRRSSPIHPDVRRQEDHGQPDQEETPGKKKKARLNRSERKDKECSAIRSGRIHLQRRRDALARSRKVKAAPARSWRASAGPIDPIRKEKP